MKKILIAPDSFKGCMSSKEVCDAIERGIRSFLKDVQIVKVPMADGGEGTVDTLVEVTGGQKKYVNVLDPLGNKIKAYFGILGDGVTAVIEMAIASGLPLVPQEMRNPMLTTTYGTGQLIKAALEFGCRDFIIGIGGSATNDGGVGMAQALGVKFLDKQGQEIGFGGGKLNLIEKIDIKNIDSRILESQFMVACDVDNPLCGSSGASEVFGPQKGATLEMVKILDKNLAYFASLINRDVGRDIKDVPGAGAAGGLGAGLMAFCNAKLKRGIELVIEATKIEEKLEAADLIITGEGRIDFQTAHGKTPIGVANIAKKRNIPVAAIVGSIGEGVDSLYTQGINVIFPIVEGPMSLDDCIINGTFLTESAANRLIRTICLFPHNTN